MDALDVLLRLRTPRPAHWWSPPLLFVTVIMTMVCLLFVFLFVDGVLGRLLDWGTTAEDRMRYAYGAAAAFDAIPIMLLGLVCSLIGWRYGDSCRISMLCSVIHIVFLGVLLATVIGTLAIAWWSGGFSERATVHERIGTPVATHARAR